MIVAVTGSRDWDDETLMRKVLEVYLYNQGAQLVVGDAPGADRIAAEIAERWSVPKTIYVAEWKKHGTAAGLIRNRRMLDQGKPEILIAFKNKPVSRGTDACIREALKRKLPVVSVTVRSE